MNKNYLICWDDDNHFANYWLNTTYLGNDIEQIIINSLKIIPDTNSIKKIYINADSFPEEIWEQLFDYFQTVPKFDFADLKLIIKKDWKNFYAKNIKKIMRKIGF